MKLRVTLLTTAMMAVTVSAIAKPPFLQTFEKTYNVKEGSKLNKAACGVCHVKAPELNPYGKDLKKALEAGGQESKEVTAETLKKVEKLDSDKDGAANLAEIKADTLPGDAKSKPAAAKATKAGKSGKATKPGKSTKKS